MPGKVEYFGIRHHGPGSARRLIEALDALKPVEVLIEGPVDLSDLIPMLADQEMVPPVALLAYPAGEPERSVFWPFAVFSPEYQAALWAVRNGVPARFIDLPVAWRWPKPGEEAADRESQDEAFLPRKSRNPTAPGSEETWHWQRWRPNQRSMFGPRSPGDEPGDGEFGFNPVHDAGNR